MSDEFSSPPVFLLPDQQPRIVEAPEMPLICDTLAALNVEGVLSAKQIEDSLSLAPRSGYPYFSVRIPDSQQLRQIFRSSHSLKVQVAILDYFTADTGWVHEHISADQDINGDGRVDTGDILDGTIAAMDDCVGALAMARAADKTGRRQLLATEAVELQKRLNAVISKAVAARRVVNNMTAQALRKVAS